MEATKIIATLENSPESWQVIFQNGDSIVFAWGDYRFTRLSVRFDCAMMLNSKNDTITMIWTADDPLISQIYSGLVRVHLKGSSRKKLTNVH